MCQVVSILLGQLVRILFALHGIFTVMIVVEMMCDKIYWLLIIGVALLTVEMAITLKFTRKAEWKWFSPMIFLYLSTMVPSIWFMELNRSSDKPPESCNEPTQWINNLEERRKYVDILERTMIIVLVIGRWLMPKGDISRDQLSELLLVYVGVGTDILDIFATFQKDDVKDHPTLIIVGLSLFTWAIMQFPFVLIKKQHSSKTCFSEIRNLFTEGFQDAPFLGYRLHLMKKSTSNLDGNTIFFTCKNILIIMLGLYRSVMAYCGRGSPEEGEREAETGI